jgi:hypothetical protein
LNIEYWTLETKNTNTKHWKWREILNAKGRKWLNEEYWTLETEQNKEHEYWRLKMKKNTEH